MGYTINNSGDLSYSAISSTYKFTPNGGTEVDVSWPITLSGSVILYIKGDFTFTTNDQHFEISDDPNNDITIEGNGQVITISGVNNYGGLVISRSNNTVIQNLGVTSNNSILQLGCGWIGNGILDMAREDFVGFLGTINNCYTTGEINYNGGGITGGGAGDFGTCNINNCYSTGSIIDRAGGICGQLSIYTGTCNINNCYSTGRVNGQNSGGIIGANLISSTSPTVLIQNCYSTGIISGVDLENTANSRAGGISGSGATTNCTIENCYVSGAITNGNTSYFVGSSSTCIPQKCSNSTDGLWSDSKASSITGGNTIGLLHNGEWKHVIDNKPWKLKVFFTSTRFVYNATGGNFVYENNIYPISSYENVTKMGLFNNGNIDLTRLVSLDTIARTKTIIGITTIANAKPTTIVLLDSVNNIVDYVDSCTVIAESGAIQYSDIDAKYVFCPDTQNDKITGNVPIAWPAIISGTASIVLWGNLEFNDINNYFIVSSDVSNNVSIKTKFLDKINISNVPNYGGLVYSRSNNTIVRSIGVSSSGTTTLAPNSGWIGRCNPSMQYSFIGTIDTCYSTGSVINNHCGGIVGNYAGYNGVCNINNCYTLGEISGNGSGGIAGSFVGINGVCNVNNCYSLGNISGVYSGGIAGQDAGITDTDGSGTTGRCTIKNCYTKGNISGGDNVILNSRAGGIIGSNGTPGCTIENCYVSGNIENGNTSYFVGENSSAIISNNCSNSTDGLWSDAIASYVNSENTVVGLSASGNIWRNVYQNTPWKLAMFLQTNQYTYNTSDNGTIYYTTDMSLFGTYSLPLTIKLSQNGVIYDNTGVVISDQMYNVQQPNGFMDTFNRIDIKNVTPLANGDLISIILVDNTNTIVGYLDCIRIQPVSESGSISYNNGTNKFIFTPNGGSPRDIIWPMNLFGGVQIDISEDLVLKDPIHYFTIGSDTTNQVVINGLNHSITINNLPYFKGFVKSRSPNTVVRNICVKNNVNTFLYTNGGWIGNEYFIGTITNSYSYGNIQNQYSGGIVGGVAGYEGTCAITNCYSVGDIVGTKSGGIVGGYSGSYLQGVCIVQNCFSTGMIGGVENGGIAGGFAGFGYGSSTITNCYSLGDINGPMSGGICGSYTYTCTIGNCYSRGTIAGRVIGDSDRVAGGIVGYNAMDKCTINNCYVAGSITNGNLSSIYGGSNFGETPAVNNCSSTTNGLWDDNIASSTAADVTTGLLVPESDSVWKQISQNVPWKLKVFTSSVNISLNEQFNILTYKNNTFPINIYPNQTSTQLINNGNILGNYTIGNDNSLICENVGAIYNSLPTYLALVDISNTIIDYIDVFTFYNVSSVVVSPTSMTLTVRQVGLINVTINPPDAYNRNFTLTSSNSNVATVNNVGGVINIYTVGPGTTQIKATSVNGGLYGICNVTVVQPVTGISINKTSLTLVKGQTYTLLAKVLPSNATNKRVTWSSSNTKVATVNSSGKVTCVSSGDVIIRVRSVNNTTRTTICKIKVTQPVTSISLSEKSITLLKGKTFPLKATISPKNATDKRVTWSSNNTKVAKVTQNGVITAVSPGTASIKVTTVNSKRASICKVIVK
jgi:uncharacterized protein YjdB